MRGKSQIKVNKRPTRDACLYMGEVTLPDSPDLHFIFAIALQP